MTTIKFIVSNRKRIIRLTQSYLLLGLGAIMLAFNFNIFLAPHNIAPGGLGGMVLVMIDFTGWSAGSMLLVLQGLMIFIGFWFLGRFQFVLRTLYVSLVFSFGVELLQSWLPPAGITDDLLLNTIYGGLVGGIGAGLIFLGGSSIAGTSVISRIVQLKTGMPISQIYIFVDGGIILLQALAFGWDKALYGIMMLFIYGLAADYVQEGPSVIRTAFVVTDRPEQVALSLFDRLRVGVTSWSGTGMFTREQRTVLFCTVSRTEMSALKQIVTETDPMAFVVIGQGHQAIGGVVRRPEKKAASAAVSARTRNQVEQGAPV